VSRQTLRGDPRDFLSLSSVSRRSRRALAQGRRLLQEIPQNSGTMAGCAAVQPFGKDEAPAETRAGAWKPRRVRAGSIDRVADAYVQAARLKSLAAAPRCEGYPDFFKLPHDLLLRGCLQDHPSSLPECNSLFAVGRVAWPLGLSPAAVWAFTCKGWSFNKRHEVVATSPLDPKSPVPPPPGRTVSPLLCGRTWCEPGISMRSRAPASGRGAAPHRRPWP
jgi:hypothetical protein